MLVAIPGPDEGLATLGLVNTLNQPKLLKFLERAVYTHQAQPRTVDTGRIIHFNRSQRTHRPFHRLDNRFARQGKPATVFLENIKPIS
jgi:hypothetical protein